MKAFLIFAAAVAMSVLVVLNLTGVVQVAEGPREGDPQAELAYAAQAGDVRLVVVGRPFPAPAPDIEDRVAAAIGGGYGGARVRFAPGPALPATGYRVVMLFDPADGAGNLCAPAPPASAGPPPAGPLQVRAAFCRDERALTTAAGAVTGVAGPDDPKFARLVTGIASALFPPRQGGE